MKNGKALEWEVPKIWKKVVLLIMESINLLKKELKIQVKKAKEIKYN